MTNEEAIADLKEALKEVDMFRKIYLKQRKVSVECEKRYASLSFAINELEQQTCEDCIKGKWIILDECANEGVYCSECHKKVFKLEFSPTMKRRNFKYCPNCGAKMEVEE